MDALVADRLPIFWRMMGVVGVVMALIVYRYLWLLGRGYVAQPGRRAGIVGVLAAVRRVPAESVRAWLSRLLLDGLLHRRLWHTDKRRWAAHLALLIGFFGLAGLSFLAAVSDHVFRPLALDAPFIAAWRDKDQPFLAALHETLGLLILLGGLMMGLRRLSRREPHLPNGSADLVIVGLLLFITVQGYKLEGLRLLMEEVPAAVARYSYIGWPLAQWMAPLELSWGAWHFWSFQVHVVACIALFLYWPFSKMMHVFLGPLVAAKGAGDVEPSR